MNLANKPGTGVLGVYGHLNRAAAQSAQTSTRRPPAPSGQLSQISFTRAGADFDVCVVPNGNQLVFASTRHRRTADIYIKAIGSAAITQLTDDPANDVMPAISPDGQRIAFASDRGGSWDLYLIDIAGGKPVRITDDSAQNLHPSFSPDGRKLVYCSYGSSSEQWELVVIDVTKPTVKKHIGRGLFPDWSPTGEKIVFQRARQRGTRWFSLWTVDMSGGEPSQFTEVAASANAAVITPAWSPDGKYLVFSTVVRPGQSQASSSNQGKSFGQSAQAGPFNPKRADVWLMKADGTGRVKLTQGQYANLQPTWGSGGGVYFISDRAGPQLENVWMAQAKSALRVVNQQTQPNRAMQSAEVPTKP